MSANGGTPEVLIPMDIDQDERAFEPQMLPDGETVLFTFAPPSRGRYGQIVTQSLETGERRVHMEGATGARYVPTGHLVFVQDETLLAVPFDLARLTVTGGPVPVVEGVARAATGFNGAAHASFSDSGSLVYVPGVAVGGPRFVWVDREGREEPVAAESQAYAEFTLSPDGAQVAVRVTDDLWIYDLRRDTLTRLTFDPARERFPLWISFSWGTVGSISDPRRYTSTRTALVPEPRRVPVHSSRIVTRSISPVKWNGTL